MSFKLSPQWVQYQKRMDQRQHSRQAAQMESFDNILTGITPTMDLLGNPRDVWTAGNSLFVYALRQ